MLGRNDLVSYQEKKKELNPQALEPLVCIKYKYSFTIYRSSFQVDFLKNYLKLCFIFQSESNLHYNCMTHCRPKIYMPGHVGERLNVGRGCKSWAENDLQFSGLKMFIPFKLLKVKSQQ